MKTAALHIIMISVLMLQQGNAQTVTRNDKCLDCHARLNEKKFQHTPSGKCSDCHTANGKEHPSKNEETGFVLSEKTPQLCNKCHTPVETGSSHRPVKKGNCTSCHEMHSSDNKRMISSQPPDLCLFCHSEIQTKADSSRSTHRIMMKGSSCLSCHFPHRAEQPKLLIKTEKELCLTCHDKTIRKDSISIRNIKKEFDQAKYMHTAITKNGCSGCHDAHGSAENGLLKSRFESTTYVIAKGTRDNVALCFTCHNPELMDAKKTETATSFRNGEVNLHNKHVSKYKGRNCINCHNVHASRNEFLLVDQSKFGKWTMPLKFTKKENGGSCVTACHGQKVYSRKKEE